MRPLIYFALLFAAAACGPDGQAPSNGIPAEFTLGIARSCEPDIGLIFAGTPLADRDSWYGRHLIAMGEPALCTSASATTYRFLWLRTFHHPVVVRVDRTDTGSFLVAHELSGAGGYEPGTVIRTEARALSDSEWSTLERAIVAAEFWQLPTYSAVNPMGLDGSQWIVEGVRGDRYHVIDRWTPGPADDGAPVHRLGMQFLRLADFVQYAEPIY